MVSGGNGILGKFQQRLRNIRLARYRKKKQNEKFVLEKTKEIRRVVENQPRIRPKGIGSEPIKDINNDKRADVKVVVDVSVSDKNKKNIDNISVQKIKDDTNYVIEKEPVYKKGISFEPVKDKQDTINVANSNGISDRKDIGEEKLESVNSDIKSDDKKENKSNIDDNIDKSYGYGAKSDTKGDNKNNETKTGVLVSSDDENSKKIKEIASDLLDRIKIEFDDCIDELDVIEGELYLLSSEEELAVTVDKIKNIRKKINEYVDKYNGLVGVYNSYKKRYYIDSVADINDDVIADDLISLRILLDNSEGEKKFVGDVKHLDNFQLLYQRLNDVRKDVEVLRNEAIKKQTSFEKRDRKHKEILEGALDNLNINKSCSEEIERQNEYFDTLMKKVNDINSKEYVTMRLRGLDDLIFMSMRYLGMVFLSPFRNTIPGMGMQMIATRNLVRNMYHQMHFEEVREIHYEAIDYSYEINNNLSDVHYVSSVIGDTLMSVERLRSAFMLQYDSKVPGYDKTLDQLNGLYDMILKNQKKIGIIEEKLNKGKLMNEEKLIRVKEMNERR